MKRVYLCTAKYFAFAVPPLFTVLIYLNTRLVCIERIFVCLFVIHSNERKEEHQRRNSFFRFIYGSGWEGSVAQQCDYDGAAKNEALQSQDGAGERNAGTITDWFIALWTVGGVIQYCTQRQHGDRVVTGLVV